MQNLRWFFFSYPSLRWVPWDDEVTVVIVQDRTKTKAKRRAAMYMRGEVGVGYIEALKEMVFDPHITEPDEDWIKEDPQTILYFNDNTTKRKT